MLQKFDRKLSAEEVYFGSKTPTLSVANKTNQKFFRKNLRKRSAGVDTYYQSFKNVKLKPNA